MRVLDLMDGYPILGTRGETTSERLSRSLSVEVCGCASGRGRKPGETRGTSVVCRSPATAGAVGDAVRNATTHSPVPLVLAAR